MRDEHLTGRTAVDVLLGHVGEVLFAEAAALAPEVSGLEDIRRHPHRLAGRDLLNRSLPTLDGQRSDGKSRRPYRPFIVPVESLTELSTLHQG